MPIITNSNAIPKEFTGTGVISMSDHGIRRLKKILKIDEKSELVPTKEETLDLVFKTSLECCKRHFGKDKAVSLNHYYMRDGLDVRSCESSIFINDTLLESLTCFINVVIYHSLYFDNPDVSLYCYRQLLFIMNEQCNNTYLYPSEENYIDVIERIAETKTLKVASDLYWGMITFLILHELSHIFLDHLGIDKGQTIAEQEYEADREAYLIFLEMIYNRGLYKKLEFLEEYIYLSPMMIIDFFMLVNFVDGTINETRYISYHPPHGQRKDFLFELFNNWERNFNTEDGNGLYHWFIDVVERFKNDLFNANEKGMLDHIKRSKEKKMNEENILNYMSEITDELINEDMLNGMLDKVSINSLLDSYVCFVADDSKKDFVLMNLKSKTAKSFKLTNIIVNFKDMLGAIIEITLATSIPSQTVQAAVFTLFLVYKVLGLSTKDLSEFSAQVLLFLHQNNAYVKKISEDDVFKHFNAKDPIGRENINAAINDLLKIKCIDMVQGEIILLEKLYLMK